MASQADEKFRQFRHTAHCEAVNCNKYKGKYPDLSFFGFPKDEERCKQWMKYSRRALYLKKDHSKLRKLVMCEEHFTADQFMNPADKGCPLLRKRLRHDAVPTIFDVPNPPVSGMLRSILKPVQKQVERESQDHTLSPTQSASTQRSEQIIQNPDDKGHTLPRKQLQHDDLTTVFEAPDPPPSASGIQSRVLVIKQKREERESQGHTPSPAHSESTILNVRVIQSPANKGHTLPKRLKHDVVPAVFEAPDPPPSSSGIQSHVLLLKQKQEEQEPQGHTPSPAHSENTIWRMQVIQSPANKSCTFPRVQLQHDAVPTVVDMPDPPLCTLRKKQPRTPKEIALRRKLASCRTALSRCRKKIRNLEGPPRVDDSVDGVEKSLKKYMSGVALDICMAQVQLQKQDRRWATETKELCLAVYHESPEAYQILCKYLSLPSQSTLRRLMAKLFDGNPLEGCGCTCTCTTESQESSQV